VLLRQPQRSSFPIRHLFSLAQRFSKDSLSDLCETYLRSGQEYSGIVSLGINKVFDESIKFHFGELSDKHVDVVIK